MKTPDPLLLPEPTYQAMAEVFRALADASRIRIVHVLSQGERTVGRLATEVGLSPSAVSHHLRALRQLGLVRFRREGTLVFYALDDRHVGQFLSESLEHVSELRREPRISSEEPEAADQPPHVATNPAGEGR